MARDKNWNKVGFFIGLRVHILYTYIIYHVLLLYERILFAGFDFIQRAKHKDWFIKARKSKKNTYAPYPSLLEKFLLNLLIII